MINITLPHFPHLRLKKKNSSKFSIIFLSILILSWEIQFDMAVIRFSPNFTVKSVKNSVDQIFLPFVITIMHSFHVLALGEPKILAALFAKWLFIFPPACAEPFAFVISVAARADFFIAAILSLWMSLVNGFL